MSNKPKACDIRNFNELASHYVESVDYRITVQNRNSQVAIIAPHGGKIEEGTSEIATTIAGDEFNLYIFEGIMKDNNYESLHLTSHRFDDKRCIQVISECTSVISIHGCSGNHEEVLLGGRDIDLKQKLLNSFEKYGIKVRVENHKFQATDKRNICNRGCNGMGVQIEVTRGLRLSSNRSSIVLAVQSVLLEGYQYG